VSTGTQIIQDAAAEIGVHSPVDPISPEGLQVGLRKLMSMLQLWQSQGIKFDFIPITIVGEELFEPPDTTNAIVSNLAILLGPTFEDGAGVIPPQLIGTAEQQYQWVKTLYEFITIPNKVASSLLIRGAGNSKGIFRQVFNGIDGTVGN